MKCLMKVIFIIIPCIVFQSCSLTSICSNDACSNIPGETRANSKLKSTAAKSLFSSAKAYVKGCNDFKVIDTKYMGKATHIGAGQIGRWEEKWTINACGRKFADIVSFRHKIKHLPDSMARDIGLTEIK